MRYKDALYYIPAILIVAASLYFFVSKEQIELIYKVSFADIFVACIIGLLNYAISGYLYKYQVSKAYSKKMELGDTLFMPVAMNMWSYIIPFQGGLLYSMAFFRLKYSISLIGSFALNVYTYMISLVFTGVIGIMFCIISDKLNSMLMLISLLFALNPILVVIANLFFKLLPEVKIVLINRIKALFQNIIKGISDLVNDKQMMIVVMAMNIIHILATILWFYWSAVALNLSIPFMAIIMLALIMRVSLIFRVTPGNLGIEQIVSGGIAVFIGATAGDGVLISLFMTLITIMLVFTVGLIHTLYNLKYFKVKSLSEFKNNILTNSNSS